MNRIFSIIIWGAAVAMVSFFIVLIGDLVLELWRQRYVTAPRVNEILFAIRLSALTATVSSVLAVLLSLPVAYLLFRYSFPGKDFFDTLLDLPIVLSPVALGAMLLLFFKSPLGGWLNQLFGPFVFSVRGIIVAQFFVVIGLSIRLVKTSFESVDIEYENIARTLGYNKVQSFLRVVIPLSWKGIVSSFLLVWGRAIGEFGATITLAGATTMKTETIPVAIYLNFESADISNALVFILLLIVMSLGLLFLMRRLQRRAGI